MRFGFLVFDDLEELDLLGPWELIGVWAEREHGPSERLLVGENPGGIRCAKGLRLTPDTTLDEAGTLDALLVPGGMGSRPAAENPRILAFVRAHAARAPLLSVCTGALVLAAAGLLDHRTATTHFASLERLAENDAIRVVEQRHVRDGHIWTSAGISAGMDMTLAYIAATAGADVAGRVQRWAEYYPDGIRHGDPAIHADMPAYVTTGE